MSPRVLIACEFSGRVRDAFLAAGCDAWSVDLLDSEAPGPHLRRDVLEVLHDGWDAMLAFPPCTYLAASGARWWKDRRAEQAEAVAFVRTLWAAPIPHIMIENPDGKVTQLLGRPTQVIEPYLFGHGERKATCLWLAGLPRLVPTDRVDGRHPRVLHEPPGPDRWRNRSRTSPGIAAAMGEQWGGYLTAQEPIAQV